MAQDFEDVAVRGPERAMQLIDALSPRDVPASFARIIVGLFPGWFDFAPDKFAVLAWQRGLHLIVSGSDYGVAIISTSDSRNIFCIYLGRSLEKAQMNMHYQPSAEQTERARTVIRLALRRLFPDREQQPEELDPPVPAGRAFPPSWTERI